MKDADSPSSANDAWYRLRNAIFDKEFGSAEVLLAQNPKLIEARNGIGETVLHFVAIEDDAAGVAWLHARGADINTKNAFGTPVLFEVAELSYQTLFDWFIEQGVNVRATDRNGQDIVAYLESFGKNEMAAYVRKRLLPN
jgi:ankyrin repeat protein